MNEIPKRSGMQKILILNTTDSHIRSKAHSWHWEDGDFIDLNNSIGFSSSGPSPWCPPTPLHAIGHGWKLIAPPFHTKNSWEWWFEK